MEEEVGRKKKFKTILVNSGKAANCPLVSVRGRSLLRFGHLNYDAEVLGQGVYDGPLKQPWAYLREMPLPTSLTGVCQMGRCSDAAVKMGVVFSGPHPYVEIPKQQGHASLHHPVNHQGNTYMIYNPRFGPLAIELAT